jgi:hypothetical protein
VQTLFFFRCFPPADAKSNLSYVIRNGHVLKQARH